MAYTGSGQLIEATDYNGIVSTTVGGNITFVMGTGQSQYGYGQDTSLISTVSATDTVTAAQWAGMFYMLNRALGHQGSTLLAGGSNLNAVSGSTITHFANVATAATSIFTNAATFGAQGSTTTGSNFDDAVSRSDALSAQVYGTRTVTFASANAARYFFNAGGQLNYVVSTPTAAGSGRNANFVGLIGGLGGWGQKNTTATGRTGSGQTLNTNSTTFGYRNNVLNTWTSVVAVTSTAGTYTSDTAAIQVQTNSSDTTNGANGLTVQFRSIYTIGDKTWDDTITVTHRTRVDIVYPETTYLSGTAWGTPIVS
jgi:hypothetical protein